MKTILIMLSVVVLASLPVSAQIPRLINYQGVLTDDMGAVVADGPYNMTFRLYDAPSGGSPLWEETIAVNVSKGIFNTTLGYDVPITELFDEPLYLALEIEGGGELSPRRIFTANAYAFSSRAVYGVSNIFPAEGNVGIGVMAPEAPLHIYTNIADSNEPSLLLQNTGNQTSIDFMMALATEARIRKAAGGDLFIGNVTGSGISFTLNNTSRHRMLPDGSFGVDNLSPMEKLDVNGAIRLGTTADTNAGTIRWTGTDFEGYDGSLWQSLTSGGGSSLPAGTSGQTLRHDGDDWIATSNLYNNGTNIGIGTSVPTSPLHIVDTAGQVALQVDSDDGSWASIYVNATNPTGKPSYGYQKQNITRGNHFLDSSFKWNLYLDGNYAMVVQPNGWASFGSTAIYESLNIPGALKLGNNTNNNAGTIRWTGSDFEGYNGSSWNSFTAGSLPTGTAGQTLRYNGGWVAAGNLYNNGTDIGIGTASPSSNLHIMEDTDAMVGITIENPSTGTSSGEAIIFQDENGQLAGIRLYDDTSPTPYAGAMAFYNNRPSGSVLFNTGGVRRMKLFDTGDLELYGASNMSTKFWSNANGGNFRLYDESGAAILATTEADANGSGGYFSVRRNDASPGFTVDGNYQGSEAAYVSISGTARSSIFNMNDSGNSSVVLPADAIGSAEILNEPGVASDWRTVTYALSSGPSASALRSITVPAAGYVFAIATAEIQLIHTNLTGDSGAFGISDNPSSFASGPQIQVFIPGPLPTASYWVPVTVQGVFEVASPGTYTYYLLGREDMGDVRIADETLTLIYVPTMYGTVDILTMAEGDAPSDSDPALERTESEEINNSRVERELAAMRDRIAALEKELGNR
jgi:hypothetical protein